MKDIVERNSMEEFIGSHFDDDPDRLLLGRSRWPGIDAGLAVSTILGHRKIRDKVPSWYRNPRLIFPSSLSVEQCSSEFTAESRTDTIRELLSGPGRKADLSQMKIADLTGGLGVDSFVFSRHFGQVLYNEMDRTLADAVSRNFNAIGCGNITVCNRMIGSASSLPAQQEGPGAETVTPAALLSGFAPDIIYLDPARRASDGRKVFRIEDCRPDILQIRDELMRIARLTAVKLSPMADIDIVIRSLGPHCRRIDVISSGNECKEIVAYLDREYEGECTICAKCSGKGEFLFTRIEENAAEVILPDSGFNRTRPESGNRTDTGGTFLLSGDGESGSRTDTGGTFPLSGDGESGSRTGTGGAFLLEPDKALMKAGAFKLPCSRFGLTMLDRSTHYYISPSLHANGSGPDLSTPESPQDKTDLKDFFRIFRIIRILPLDKKGLRTAGKDFPQAEVTARNIPMSSEELRKRLKVKSSDRYHIFGLKLTAAPEPGHSPAASGNYLFVTERI